MVGEEKENKKMRFHQMTTKSTHISWICLALLDGDPSITTKFDYHCWMANKMDSIHDQTIFATIKFGCYC